MNEQEHEQESDETEETIQDLDVPEEDAEDVQGGRKAGDKV